MAYQPITNMTPNALAEAFQARGDSIHRARLLSKHLYRQDAVSFMEMDTISKNTRKYLVETFMIPKIEIVQQLKSEDGTIKFLFRLPDGLLIESVLIPNVGKKEGKRALCISSQVGCAMGCVFCSTGTMGLKRNLETWEIIEQFREVRRTIQEDISHIIFMGMGEPLHNLQNVLNAITIFTHVDGVNLPARRISVSTSGLVPQLKILAENTDVLLAVTLSAANDKLRSQIMPVNQKWSLTELRKALMVIAKLKKDRVFIEYVLLRDVNDQLHHAKELIAFLIGVPCKVNLIAFNEAPGLPFRRPADQNVFRFSRALRDAGLSCSIRTTRGQDIQAACGQLVTRSRNVPAPAYQNTLSY